jgi:adenylylsulfate kinase
MSRKFNLFIGRWSPFHNGHKTIIDSFINNGKPVCVAIRESDEKYPVSIRMEMIKAVYKEKFEEGIVKIITIPDITQVCIGRGVGYSVVEVDKDIKKISATDIRAGKSFEMPEEVKEVIEKWEGIQKTLEVIENERRRERLNRKPPKK